MRIFETYPPSSAVISMALALAMLIGGLQFAVMLGVGAGAATIGHHLDFYGVRHRR